MQQKPWERPTCNRLGFDKIISAGVSKVKKYRKSVFKPDAVRKVSVAAAAMRMVPCDHLYSNVVKEVSQSVRD